MRPRNFDAQGLREGMKETALGLKEEKPLSFSEAKERVGVLEKRIHYALARDYFRGVKLEKAAFEKSGEKPVFGEQLQKLEDRIKADLKKAVPDLEIDGKNFPFSKVLEVLREHSEKFEKAGLSIRSAFSLDRAPLKVDGSEGLNNNIGLILKLVHGEKELTIWGGAYHFAIKRDPSGKKYFFQQDSELSVYSEPPVYSYSDRRHLRFSVESFSGMERGIDVFRGRLDNIASILELMS